MQLFHLDGMSKGWFVGDFSPCAYRTPDFEVAVKQYRAGEREALHQHRVATEITVIVSGKVSMCGREFSAGDIVLLEPGDATAFEALTDAVNVVVKFPSVAGDKYVIG